MPVSCALAPPGGFCNFGCRFCGSHPSAYSLDSITRSSTGLRTLYKSISSVMLFSSTRNVLEAKFPASLPSTTAASATTSRRSGRSTNPTAVSAHARLWSVASARSRTSWSGSDLAASASVLRRDPRPARHRRILLRMGAAARLRSAPAESRRDWRSMPLTPRPNPAQEEERYMRDRVRASMRRGRSERVSLFSGAQDRLRRARTAMDTLRMASMYRSMSPILSSSSSMGRCATWIRDSRRPGWHAIRTMFSALQARFARIHRQLSRASRGTRPTGQSTTRMSDARRPG
mmetsp:Transcript_12669/g.26314  ORF Transcript_12669/g.26314 Transcript_12669/m.26314 type:complete len:289 (-) Transcript_12669:1012-1878(-)